MHANHASQHDRKGFVKVALASTVLAVGMTAAGCNNAGEGAVSGAALGALVGMGLGSLSGDMGTGAAAGALIGGAGGAIIGDQNERRERHDRNDW